MDGWMDILRIKSYQVKHCKVMCNTLDKTGATFDLGDAPVVIFMSSYIQKQQFNLQV